MSDLFDALRDASAVLDDLDLDDAYGMRDLRERAERITKGTIGLELQNTPRGELAALTRDAVRLRDDALALRQRHRTMQRLVMAMMD